ncbi:hypothetical protein [Pseudonocardia sp. TRM90224]|uniref:hypothetical protein n=1 Tax=Pseudonocardia sp. TRM90224 TaxID=2812678 RepID=UPI001E32AA65|nr:hypothetical protein [Pseudonocardia sp. TRM90224]
MSELVPIGAGQDPTLVTIADISVTQHWVITPSGTCALRDARWTFSDLSRTHQAIPAWAIVCAVIFALFCLLGLLFLLVKEERTDGFVQVLVQGPRLLHTVQIPVYAVHQVWDVNQRVNYVRSLAAAAG